jgi:hypothetical protein
MAEYRVSLWEKCWVRYQYDITASTEQEAIAGYGGSNMRNCEFTEIENTGEVDEPYTEVETI